MRALSPWLLALCLALGSSGAAAQGATDSAASEALFQQGLTAADAGDWPTACAKFKESHRLDPAMGTLYNIAECEEKQGHVASAWTRFEEVAQRLPASDERAGSARQRAAALLPRVPRLSVHLEGGVAGARVLRDGVELGAASLDTPLPIDPGERTVVVEAPGRRPARFTVKLAEGETRTLTVRPGEAERTGPAPPGGSDPAPGDAAAGPSPWAYGLLGLGGVGLAVGAITGVLVLGDKSTADQHCPASRCDPTGWDAVERGRTLSPVSTVGFVVGVLGVAGGLTLLLGEGDEAPPEAATPAAEGTAPAARRAARQPGAVRVGAAAGPQGWQLGVSGRF